MPFVEALITALAPHTCLNCHVEGQLLCSMCQDRVCRPMPGRCYRCRQETAGSPLCPDCRPRSPLSNIWVGTEYTDLPKQLVSQLKFDRAQAAVKPMARLLKTRVPALPDAVLVPVPTATKRMRQRGYDQAVLLARQLSRLHRAPMARLLRRQGQTRQVGAGRQQRLAQLQSAFYVTKKHVPKHVILVDDILTTGASLESAAIVLLRSGVKQVDAMVFAQRV